MAALTDALRQSVSPESISLVEELDQWSREEQAAAILIPSLLGAVLARQQRVNGGGDESLISGRRLCVELNDLYAKVLQPHCRGRPARVSEAQLSRFRTGELERPHIPIALLVLLWLSEQLALGRFHDASQLHKLLSVFNPVAAVEARVLRMEALPRFDMGAPDRPMLRGTLSRDIDQAERSVSEGLATLLGLERISSENLRRDFFVSAEANAHFLVYRRAMQGGSLVKGFLVLEPPAVRVSDAYSFNHYHFTSTKDLREARGFVLTLRNSHYFIGAIGVGRRRSVMAEVELDRPLLTEAVKCIVINRDFGVHDNAVWSGLFLSHDTRFLPITGRCVLVRARHETWQESGIGLIKTEALEADIAAFADTAVAGDGGSLATLASAILRAIDNSYEPPREGIGDDALAGPLTTISLANLT